MQSEPLLLPIREVTRLTGVNPVTLRAWERRYGLIVPHRTPKGHRLYDQTHVQRIHMILHWLNRGVTVGQVKPLLENQEQASREPPQDDWQRLRLHLIEAVASLAERRLDQQLNQAMALYPVSTLCEHLFLPLLADLQARWHGYPNARMEQVFFHSWLRTKLSVRVYHNNRQLGGEPVLLVNASQLPFDPLLWLGAWLLSDAGCAVEVFDWPLPARELPIAVEQLHATGLLLSLDGAIDVRELHRALAPVTVPTLLFGSAVSLYRQALQRSHEAPPLHLLDTPLAAAQLFLSLHANT